jgi:hypothetical protein
MKKKLISLFIAGAFGLIIGIAGFGTGSVYAEGSKKLVAEGAVFDLKAATTSNIQVYGFVSDKAFHAIEGAEVILKPTKGPTLESQSDEDGLYRITGVDDNTTYTIQARKGGLGSTQKIKFKTAKNESRDFCISLQFKKAER